MKILQITDPHVYGSASARLRGVQTDATLRAVLEQALAHPADYSAVLVTGDLVQDDTAGYLRFRSMLGNLRTPVLCIPGNHDEPEAMQRELDMEPFRFCGAHEFGAWNFVMLNSYDPGCVGGRLSSAELDRLDAALAASPRHSMVCLHHHPVAVGSRWLDNIGLANAADFWRVIDAHECVRAVTWGHVHQAYEARRGAVQLYATPSTGAQFLPGSDRYALDSRPPAYRTFELHSDGRITTEVHWVESLPMQRAAAQ
jgi:3',5'-cyclic-AMP phosphodiesterase